MQLDWAATMKTMFDDIRCPRCMDEQMLSKVTVTWISNVEGGKVLQCACNRGHEFEHEVIVDGA